MTAALLDFPFLCVWIANQGIFLADLNYRGGEVVTDPAGMLFELHDEGQEERPRRNRMRSYVLVLLAGDMAVHDEWRDGPEGDGPQARHLLAQLFPDEEREAQLLVLEQECRDLLVCNQPALDRLTARLEALEQRPGERDAIMSRDEVRRIVSGE